MTATAIGGGYAVGQQQQGPTEFNAGTVRKLAQEFSRQPFRKPERALPKELQDLDYDAYRSLRFRPEKALWRGEGLPFELQFFQRGFIFLDRVELFQVVDGRASPILYSPDLFEFGSHKPPEQSQGLGFAGFRIHSTINRPDYFDEVAVFLGASYFRAVGKGQGYGLSARGLSVRTADTRGEEFPAFRAFWIEKPSKGATSIVVHALLETESASGAFRFSVRPGNTTIFDVEAALYPRTEIAEVGLAPLTSMFLFDTNDRQGIDDYRQAVHDSDGLAVKNGRGEELWRPLSNPRDLQISMFADSSPRGFGLLQRERTFEGYQDVESRFEKRPSLWVEPIGDWGNGAVHLIEIPSKDEIHDNIVAFWRPEQPLAAKGEIVLTYRLHWTNERPGPAALVDFTKTRIGTGPEGARRFVLDLKPRAHEFDLAGVTAEVTVDKGEVRNIVLGQNPATGGLRLAFDLHPKREVAVELRALLVKGADRISEVWSYRWTPN